MKNNLRISHESLDMDDIISDLNPGSAVTAEQTSQMAEIPSFRSQVKTAAAPVSKNLKSPVANKKVQKSSGYGQQRPTTAKETKENKNIKNLQSYQAARQLQKKDSVEPIKFESLQSFTTKQETAAEVSEKVNNRYAPALSETTSIEPPKVVVEEPVPEITFTATDEMAETLDSENFTQRLDQLILGFRSETMTEFIKTKGRLNHQKEQAIDAERRRCQTLLQAKQNEIEQLKENLAKMTKMKEEYSLRCEIMALWSGKGQTLARMKVVHMKCFRALKNHVQFKKHSKMVLENKGKKDRVKKMRNVFQAWVKDFKVAKVRRDKEKFDNAVKMELQSISATYQKEIETLRGKVMEAERSQAIQNRNKHIMQENLKKVFMRSVCALNFEAMNILDPNEQNQMQQALEKQVDNAMYMGMGQMPPTGQMPPGTNPIQDVLNDIQHNPMATRSEVSFNLSEAQHTERDFQSEQRELMVMGMGMGPDANSRKIESKDQMWKPAPIIQHRQMESEHSEQQLSITQKLAKLREEAMMSQQMAPGQQMPPAAVQNNYMNGGAVQHTQNYISPQQFDQMRSENRFEDLMAQINEKNAMKEREQQQMYHQQEEDVPTFFAQNPFMEAGLPSNLPNNLAQTHLPQNLPSNMSSLPSNVNMMASLPQVNNANHGEGKAIYARGGSGIQGQTMNGGGAAIKVMTMKTTQAKKAAK